MWERTWGALILEKVGMGACDRNCLIASVMCNISHIQLIGKVVTSFKVYIRRFRNEKGTGPSYVSQRPPEPLKKLANG